MEKEHFSLGATSSSPPGCCDNLEGASAISCSSSESSLSCIPLHHSAPSLAMCPGSEPNLMGKIRDGLTRFNDRCQLFRRTLSSSSTGPLTVGANEVKGAQALSPEKDVCCIEKEVCCTEEDICCKEKDIYCGEKDICCEDKNNNNTEDMQSVRLREKRVTRAETRNSTAAAINFRGLGEEWEVRLSDYQFLSGKDDDKSFKRQPSLFRRRDSSKNKRHTIIGPFKQSPNKNTTNIEEGYKCGKCSKTVHKNCINHAARCETQQTEHPWIAEGLTRRESEEHLGLACEGTFLVRWSLRHQKNVLSLKAMGEVKHMRVFQKDENGFFFLSEARYFRTISDLVNYYRISPLSESFNGLECCLRRPLYDIAMVKYAYAGNEPGQLPLVPGQKLTILSREGEIRGWWKGRIGRNVGYFPKEYVKVETDFLNHQW